MKIPKQFRIVFKEQFDYEFHSDGTHTKTPTIPLGFANPYEPKSKAYEKRCATQDMWAYGLKWAHDQDDPSYFYKNEKVYTRKRVVKDGCYVIPPEYIEEIVPENLQPIILDNVPLEGFKIQHSVSRYSTSNKLWRILDPRGFELEITTGDMENLIMSGDISKGLILGKCIWRGPKTLIRVP